MRRSAGFGLNLPELAAYSFAFFGAGEREHVMAREQRECEGRNIPSPGSLAVI
jgi:hypothetical protein